MDNAAALVESRFNPKWKTACLYTKKLERHLDKATLETGWPILDAQKARQFRFWTLVLVQNQCYVKQMEKVIPFIKIREDDW